MSPLPRARTAPRAEATSDVQRPRSLLWGALVAATLTAGGVAWLGTRADLTSPGPLARPHAQAKLACASCHAKEDARTACGSCHGQAHKSTRAGHRALAAKGELACVTCHPAHGGYRGVTFADKEAILWSPGAEVHVPLDAPAPAGATVPLVPARACAGCHVLADPRDPIARCLPAGPSSPDVSTFCFDEHQRVDQPAEATGARCARQHGDARFAAWEAARRVATVAPPSATVEAPRGPWTVAGLALFGSLAGLGGVAFTRRARKRPAPVAAKAPLAPSARVRLPQVNAATCLGCYACVDACPFDVFEIQRYTAVVARPGDCCGVVLCEQVCPNGSITIQEGDPVEDRARVDAHLESVDAPGVFLAGDLTGLPLIKNAINQGVRVIDRVADTLPSRERGRADRLDVLVVGAGPAGLSAALRAREKGLSCAIVEQGTVASSIQSFPRDKLVFDQPLDLPVEGELWLKEATKEELLAQWLRIVRVRKLEVREHTRVSDIRREGDRFVVVAQGEHGPKELSAARIVLAIGRRGSPRKLPLEIAPGAEAKVGYALADARTFAGRKVLIVGLGDAAMEAALAIARQPGAEVTMSYRGTGFVRGKARNVAELKKLLDRGALKVLFESHLRAVRPGGAALTVRGETHEIHNDYVLVLVGGVPSWDLVERAGVRRAAVPIVDPTRGENLSRPRP